MRGTIEDRFWSFTQVCKHGYDCEDCCWPWVGTIVGHMGYGQLFIGIINGKHIRKGAHIVSWRIHNRMQKLSKGEQILHTCDNPPCVQPSHLFRGTHIVNMADMRSKGRQNKAKGEVHHKTHLSEQNVLDIRRLYASGKWSQRKLAEWYRITQPSLQKILKGQTWAHIHDGMHPGINTILTDRTAVVLTNDKVYAIRELLALGWNQKDIAKEFGCNKNTISEINVGHTHR